MGRRVPTFAVRLGQIPYGFIGRFQAFDGTNKVSPVLAREIFDAFRKNKQTRQRMAQVVVTLFEESGSFAEAKARIGYLETLDSWDTSFLTRVQSALKSNSQIWGSWGVPDRVEALVQKWAKSTF